ncbi:MAG: AgmX/PglI C-terminal domain-containing protein [Candidatus Fermentibacteraceae bacterium]
MIRALLAALTLAAASAGNEVDRAIDLYMMGDIPGAISALEDLLEEGGLSYDEQLRVWERLGSAYYAMGQTAKAEEAYLNLVSLDTHYQLPPTANPRLRQLLQEVREEHVASAEVTSDPDGALVALDGELMGVTPLSLPDLLAGRSYEIAVYAEGYAPEVRSITPEAGAVHVMDFGLSEASGDSAAAVAVEEGGSSADLVNVITSSQGGGIDMAALAGSGAMSGERSAGGMAGSQAGTVGVGDTSSGGPVFTRQDLEQSMVFTDVTSSGSGSPGGSGATVNSRSSDDIMEVLTQNRSQITHVYNKHLRNDPLLSGTVEMEMVIEPSGRVSDVNIVSSNTYNPAFELELARTVETWRFGAVDEDEGSLIIQYPFSFQ